MKKFIGILVLCFSLILSFSAFAEDMKTLKYNINGQTVLVTISELAPDFFNFPNKELLFGKTFSNGNAFALAQYVNKDETVSVIPVFIKQDENISIVQMIVTYFLGTDKETSEFYEDTIYVKTGKVTHILMKVKDPSDPEKVVNHLKPKEKL